MIKTQARRMSAGIVMGALLGLVPTVMVATGQTSPPESAPTSTTTTVAPSSQAVPVGSTWYVDGNNAKAGPVGSTIRVYAVGAFTNLAYQLVLGTGDPSRACATVVHVLNPNLRFANSAGFIPVTVGTVGPDVAPGTYKLCFEDASTGNFTGTAGATFTVLAS